MTDQQRAALAWTAAAAAGVALHAAGLADALIDRAYVEALALDIGTHEIASTHVHNETARLIVKGSWLLLGVAVLITGRHPRRSITVVSQLVLVGGVVTLDMAALAERRARKRIIEQAKRQAAT